MKRDFKKELKELYSASAKKCAFVTVPEMNFIMADGAGDPNNNPSFQEAVEALFSVSYTIKFAVKKAGGGDFAVMPLEGLWWADGPFDNKKRDNWLWTAMIMQPPHVTAQTFNDALKTAAAKKELPGLARLRFEKYAEGKAAQLLHIGPFSTEPATIRALDGFIAENGYERSGKHHEIYLTDMRRTAPEKLKTIIRHPMMLVKRQT